MPSEIPGETDRESAIRALRQIAQARIAAREEREGGTRGRNARSPKIRVPEVTRWRSPGLIKASLSAKSTTILRRATAHVRAGVMR